MGIIFKTFDFNESSYDNSKDQLIAQNSLGLKSWSKFKKYIVEACSDHSATDTTLSDEYRIIKGPDFRKNFLRKYKVLYPEVSTKLDDLWSEELGTEIMILPYNTTVGTATMLENNPTDPTKANMIPSIQLKDYFSVLQKSIREPKELWLKPEGGRVSDIAYTSIEAAALISKVKSLLQSKVAHANLTLPLSMVTDNRFVRQSDGTLKWVTYTELRVETSGNNWPYAIVTTTDGYRFSARGKSYSQKSIFNYVEPKRYWGEPLDLGSLTSTKDHIIEYRDGLTSSNSGPLLPISASNYVLYGQFTPSIATEDQESVITDNNRTFEYTKQDYIMSHIRTAGDKDPAGTFSKISDTTWDVDDTVALNILFQMIGKYSENVNFTYELEEFNTTNSFGFNRNLLITFGKESLLALVDEFEASMAIDEDIILAVAEGAKESALGQVLASSGYLEGLLVESSISQISELYLSFYIPLTNKVNNLSDPDEAVDLNFYKTMIKYTSNRLWDYVDVAVKVKSISILFGQTYYLAAPVAIIPRWDRLKTAPARIAGNILTTMLHIDQKPKKPKKNWAGVIITIIGAILITVASGGSGSYLAYISIAAAWVGAVAVTAQTLTGSKKWGETAKVAGYVGMVTGLASGIYTALKNFTVAVALQYAIQIASIGFKEDHRRKMKRTANELADQQTEQRDIITMDDHFDMANKIERFIFSDSYSEKYNYTSNIYETPKRC